MKVADTGMTPLAQRYNINRTFGGTYTCTNIVIQQTKENVIRV
ncbi:hypothetical protein [Wolbachia endosymbiont of Drosophila mauritiana]|nr:hypothetical protein [Wolbachia endosymbiont of Drosophila mauritiana]